MAPPVQWPHSSPPTSVVHREGLLERLHSQPRLGVAAQGTNEMRDPARSSGYLARIIESSPHAVGDRTSGRRPGDHDTNPVRSRLPRVVQPQLRSPALQRRAQPIAAAPPSEQADYPIANRSAW